MAVDLDVVETRHERQSLDAYDKLLLALTAFEERQRWSLGDLAKKIGLPKSTVHRALSKLKAYDLIAQDGSSREYFPGYRLRALAKSMQDSGFVGSVAREHLGELTRLSGESSFLTMPDGVHGLCVARTEASHPLRITMDVGTRAPLHRGASNVILLAYLPEAVQESIASYWVQDVSSRLALMQRLASIRLCGFAYSVSELSPGAAAIAVPILDRDGDLVAGLSLSGPTERLPIERARHFLPELREHAMTVARELGVLGVLASASRKQ